MKKTFKYRAGKSFRFIFDFNTEARVRSEIISKNSCSCVPGENLVSKPSSQVEASKSWCGARGTGRSNQQDCSSHPSPCQQVSVLVYIFRASRSDQQDCSSHPSPCQQVRVLVYPLPGRPVRPARLLFPSQSMSTGECTSLYLPGEPVRPTRL